MEGEWSRADVIGAWTLGVTVAGAFAAWLAVPGLREWIAGLWNRSDPIGMGDLSDAAPQHTDDPLLPGVVRADKKTLKALLDATESVDWKWLRAQDFSEPFSKSLADKVDEYSYQHTHPQNEFLDAELEKLRSAFNAAATNFTALAQRSSPVFPPKNDLFEIYVHITPHMPPWEWQQARSERARQLNVAAKVALDTYEVLVRRARVKLAMGASPPEKAV